MYYPSRWGMNVDTYNVFRGHAMVRLYGSVCRDCFTSLKTELLLNRIAYYMAFCMAVPSHLISLKLALFLNGSLLNRDPHCAAAQTEGLNSPAYAWTHYGCHGSTVRYFSTTVL